MGEALTYSDIPPNCVNFFYFAKKLSLDVQVACVVYLLGLGLDVDDAAGPAAEVVAHEGVDLGEQALPERGGADEAEHDAVERAVHGGDVVAAEDVEHGLRVARDEAAGLAISSMRRLSSGSMDTTVGQPKMCVRNSLPYLQQRID